MDRIDKNRPSPQWLAALRKRYPTEREIDRVLTRRLERRAGPGYSPLPLTTLIEGLLQFSLSFPVQFHSSRSDAIILVFCVYIHMFCASWWFADKSPSLD